MSETQSFRGVYTALVTPMKEDGSIDWNSLSALVEAQVSGGAQGIVPTGTTGESPTLDNAEHLEVIGAVVKAAAGRIPVIAGTGANSTTEALYLTGEADRLGADAFLQVAPYYNKPSQEGLFQHFKAIADSTRKPIILYSIPGRCGIEIEVETVSRLSKACPNICAIKEAGGQVEKVRALKAACPEVTVLSGDDGLIIPFIEAGAEGVISVASNISPEVISQLTEACLAGDTGKAKALAKDWELLLTELVFLEGNPVTIKEVLFQAGRIPSPAMRLPLVRMPEASRGIIRDHLLALNYISA
ncbi:4-hydroxy-tetrahydrodipicolinate synthase [Puniceicoccales bacterium CK1056]|uniref:4-hydroxy-tetrahydrodipicolinate synthase n=1 Tax=Oceanipulchritudo coccoides TaxID=2706888 RepID=A0A6B2M1R8_9BACT|nr:4-hydroxy-tetrahydrodipicolinate synthase [Oceanipulchritudo coccoides]NDV61680.1 4-hydroxy-tetrahydrodipicolinate synthase [Oceanipulchritudo coccoides]